MNELSLVEVVRGLGPADLVMLSSASAAPAQAPTVARLSHSHHALAQALARGDSAAKAGLIAGYSISRISVLQKDPSFRELLDYYATQTELVHVDVLQRMQALGMNSLEELQHRLETEPGGFAARELMELAELMLVKGRQGAGGKATAGTAVGGPGVSVNVHFVTADHHPLIDVKPLNELEAAE